MLEDFYTYGPFKPRISIQDNYVSIEIDVQAIKTQEADYRRAVSLCEKGHFKEAKGILKHLIGQNPTNSEFHRIMGQIFSEEGDQDTAIDYLIDALRWDSKNGYALVMMGNIFARFKNDVETALRYYHQALAVNPRDHISMNHIGVFLLQEGKTEEGKRYLQEALKVDDTYPNTHHALGLVAEMESDYAAAFESVIRAIKLNGNRDVLFKKSVQKAFELAMELVKQGAAAKLVDGYKHQLEYEGERAVRFLEDKSIPTAAKFEFAENYGRDHHLVKFRPGYLAFEHLIMHELVHLDFVIQARKANNNRLFVSNQEHRAAFIKKVEPAVRHLSKAGISAADMDKYASQLFDGINTQAYNAPINLFIENFLYTHKELRPYQFLSLYHIVQEGIKAVTDKNVVKISPKEVLSKSKIYNLVNALQFRELYGIDLVQDFQPSHSELKTAQDFYEEYREYRDDKGPGEEYELIQHWAEDLKLDGYFELVDEEHYRSKRADIDNLLASLEADPFELEQEDPGKEREMDKFLESQKKIGVNMAVVMFMVDALQFFEKMDLNDVRKMAYDIALQGAYGYSPEKSDYRINGIKGKTFSGYHILAYYYVSWALSLPDMLEDLQLPYSKEYEMALTMYRGR